MSTLYIRAEEGYCHAVDDDGDGGRSQLNINVLITVFWKLDFAALFPSSMYLYNRERIIYVFIWASGYEIFGLSILLLYLGTQWMGENGWLTSGAMGFDNNVQIEGNAISWMLSMVWYFYAF